MEYRPAVKSKSIFIHYYIADSSKLERRRNNPLKCHRNSTVNNLITLHIVTEYFLRFKRIINSMTFVR